MNIADANLDIAEQEFSRRAFSPFWTAIEAAVQQLGEVARGFNRLGKLAKQYLTARDIAFKDNELLIRLRQSQWDDVRDLASQKLSEYTSVPDFPVSLKFIHTLGATNTLSSRMNEMVDRAHTDFEFATIFEQRRTSNILIAGFQNLERALAGVGSRLSAELKEVASSIAASVNAAANAAVYAASADADARAATAASDLSEASYQRKEMVRMLDNIQRGREPIF